MNKKVFSILLAGTMAASVVAGSAISASAVKTEHSKYTPSAGVVTNKYYIAMPAAWINDSTHDNNDVPGLYWWSAEDNPGDVFDNGWPGYECDKETGEEGVDNLYSINAPKSALTLVWSNYLDGGMDVTAPVFTDAKQCVNFSAEFNAEGDSDNYSDAFWEYVYTHEEDMDFSEFGIYKDNFFDDELYGSGIVHDFKNMVFIVSLDRSKMEIDYDIVPEGKEKYAGEMYFYYGNGEYGMWPTKELAISQEGLEFDADGNAVGADEYGSVYNDDGYLIYGNFTGKYASENALPTQDEVATTAPSSDTEKSTTATGSAQISTPDEQTTTTASGDSDDGEGVPAPANDDANSSTSDSSGDSASNGGSNSDNGAVQTGAPTFVVVLTLLVAGAVSVIFVSRKKFVK